MRPAYNCERQGLAPLADVSSLCLLELGGHSYCLAASGDETGSCVLIGLEKRNYFPVQPLEGKILSMISLPSSAGAFLAVRQKDREAALVLGRIIPRMDNEKLLCETVVLLQQYQLHWICLAGGRLLALIGEAASLGLFEIPLEREQLTVGSPNLLLSGLGDVISLSSREDANGIVHVLLSSTEGNFVLSLQENSVWMIQPLSAPCGGSSCWAALEEEPVIVHSSGGVFCRKDDRWQKIGRETVEGCLLCGGSDLVYSMGEAGELVLSGLQKTADGVRVRALLTEEKLYVRQMLRESENSLLAAVGGEGRVDRFRVF